ncbi:MAG: N-acetylmuramoyl-L-alanine amidase [Myxococcales bacterium]|nr:N-acetylmuramoyl-L-alanine amidase [Myxococcales bacterium]
MRRRRLLTHAPAALALGGAAALGLAPRRAAARTAGVPYEQTRARNRAMFEGMFELDVPLLPYEWIVVHHTAAEYATLEGIDRYHRNHFGDPLGAEYHFVINNGKKRPQEKPLGLVEQARWRYQEWAAHLFHPERAPASCAICLIGNFEQRALPEEMLDALVELTRVLMARFEIPAARVTTHRGVDKRLTQCPGKLFPREEFLARLAAPAVVDDAEPHA